MKLRNPHHWRNSNEVFTIPEAVDYSVREYDSNMSGEDQNLAQLLGKLIEVLEETNVLSESDVLGILGYGFEEIKEDD